MTEISSTNLGAQAAPAPAAPAAEPAVQEQAKPEAAPVIERIALFKVDPKRMALHLSEVATQLNQQLARNNVSVGFHIDEVTGHPVMTLRSTVSGEVLREVPGHAALAVAHSIEQFKGMFLNRKA